MNRALCQGSCQPMGDRVLRVPRGCSHILARSSSPLHEPGINYLPLPSFHSLCYCHSPRGWQKSPAEGHEGCRHPQSCATDPVDWLRTMPSPAVTATKEGTRAERGWRNP